MTIVGPRASGSADHGHDEATPMGPTARLVRSLTPQRLVAASRPLRARIRESTPAAAWWTARKRAKYVWRAPRTFNEKVEYKLAWDRRPIVRTFADKVAVRDHVAAIIGDDILVPQYAVVDDPRALDLGALPSRYVVKPSHASGAVIVVHDQADPALRLPTTPTDRGWVREIAWVRPEHLDRATFDATCDHWLRHDYWRALGSTEWAYRGIPRRLVVEEFLEDGTHAPRDYKFNVMHGEVFWYRINVNDEHGHRSTNYRRDGSLIPVVHINPSAEPPAEIPASIDEMIRIAEALGAGTDFVRVDLYEIGGRILFGELTNYPSAGRGSFDPPEYDEILGADWAPPPRYRDSAR
jgi:hypothetical protein